MSVVVHVLCLFPGSNVMRSIHGVGELMSQVVLRGGGFLPTTSNTSSSGDTVKSQTEPEKQDILVMDTKLKIIEILQVEDTQCYTYSGHCTHTVHTIYRTQSLHPPQYSHETPVIFCPAL